MHILCFGNLEYCDGVVTCNILRKYHVFFLKFKWWEVHIPPEMQRLAQGAVITQAFGFP
jgi:hypothetical protein